MNTYSKKPVRAPALSSLVRCLAVAAPLLVVGASAAEAAAPCVDAHRVLDVRLAGLADRGVAPFVQFVHRTRTINQMDVTEALARVATYRKSVAACKAAVDE